MMDRPILRAFRGMHVLKTAQNWSNFVRELLEEDIALLFLECIPLEHLYNWWPIVFGALYAQPLSAALDDKAEYGPQLPLIKVYGSFRPIRQQPGVRVEQPPTSVSTDQSGKPPTVDNPRQLQLVQRCENIPQYKENSFPDCRPPSADRK